MAREIEGSEGDGGARATRRGRRQPEAGIRKRNEAKILRAAVELFSRKGYDGTRMAEIAEESGLPKANVYYYFPTKAEIYARLIEDLLTGWDKALEHIVPEADPREALTAYVEAKLDYARTHAAESRFFSNEMLRGGGFFSARQKRHMRDVTRKHAAVLEGWIREGRMAPVDPRHFFIMIWSTTQYYTDFEPVAAVTLERRNLTRTDFRAAAATILRIVLDGCLPPSPPSGSGRSRR